MIPCSFCVRCKNWANVAIMSKMWPPYVSNMCTIVLLRTKSSNHYWSMLSTNFWWRQSWASMQHGRRKGCKVHSRLGYTKGMSHLKITHRTVLWMTIMFTNSFILVIYFFHLILTFFVIEVVVIICDFDDLNMSLNFLEHISRMLSHYAILLKRNQ